MTAQPSSVKEDEMQQCPRCEGRTWIWVAYGTAKLECPRCNGSGKINELCTGEKQTRSRQA